MNNFIWQKFSKERHGSFSKKFEMRRLQFFYLKESKKKRERGRAADRSTDPCRSIAAGSMDRSSVWPSPKIARSEKRGGRREVWDGVYPIRGHQPESMMTSIWLKVGARHSSTLTSIPVCDILRWKNISSFPCISCKKWLILLSHYFASP